MYFGTKIFSMISKGFQRWNTILAEVTPVAQVTTVYGMKRWRQMLTGSGVTPCYYRPKTFLSWLKLQFFGLTITL